MNSTIILFLYFSLFIGTILVFRLFSLLLIYGHNYTHTHNAEFYALRMCSILAALFFILSFSIPPLWLFRAGTTILLLLMLNIIFAFVIRIYSYKRILEIKNYFYCQFCLSWKISKLQPYCHSSDSLSDNSPSMCLLFYWDYPISINKKFSPQ